MPFAAAIDDSPNSGFNFMRGEEASAFAKGVSTVDSVDCLLVARALSLHNV